MTSFAPNGTAALLGQIEELARSSGRPTRALRLQALLQLPRLMDAHGRMDEADAADVLSTLALELPAAEEWTAVVDVDSPTGLDFSDNLPLNEVNRVMRRFHYLRSPRFDGRAYGLFSRAGRLVVLCYVSPLDVPGLARLIDAVGVPSATAKVVSRVFAFEDAPRNSLSYLLARVGYAEEALGVTNLVTYVNPNMGFTGASYRSAGWVLLGQEAGTVYRYLDERYITCRELVRRFGSLTDAGYDQLLGSRFQMSRVPLLPLLVFHKQLTSDSVYKKQVTLQRSSPI